MPDKVLDLTGPAIAGTVRTAAIALRGIARVEWRVELTLHGSSGITAVAPAAASREPDTDATWGRMPSRPNSTGVPAVVQALGGVAAGNTARECYITDDQVGAGECSMEFEITGTAHPSDRLEVWISYDPTHGGFLP